MSIEESSRSMGAAKRVWQSRRSRAARGSLAWAIANLALVGTLGGMSPTPSSAQPASDQASVAMSLDVARRLADAGQPEGLYQLGRFYEVGREVARDPMQAARRYESAAELGHVEAQYSLALLLTGADPGVPRSSGRSVEWFEEAAMQGHSSAQYFLALNLEAGVDGEPSPEVAFEWYRQASMQGHARAMGAVARLCAEGPGTLQRDLVKAHAWSRVAANAGEDVPWCIKRDFRPQLCPPSRIGTIGGSP
jgi:TPR repeat protein